MVDTVAPDIRSRMMSAVKGKNTRPELEVRRAPRAAGLQYRLHRRDLPGRPDIVLPRFKVAVFVHGCFWHGHNCRRGKRAHIIRTVHHIAFKLFWLLRSRAKLPFNFFSQNSPMDLVGQGNQQSFVADRIEFLDVLRGGRTFVLGLGAYAHATTWQSGRTTLSGLHSGIDSLGSKLTACEVSTGIASCLLRLPNLSVLQLPTPFAFPACCKRRHGRGLATCWRMAPEREWIIPSW